jgi:hypothetical protein
MSEVETQRALHAPVVVLVEAETSAGSAANTGSAGSTGGAAGVGGREKHDHLCLALRSAGFRVVRATGEVAALAIVEHAPRVIIADTRDDDGRLVAALFRATQRRPAPVIVLAQVASTVAVETAANRAHRVYPADTPPEHIVDVARRLAAQATSLAA